MFFVLATYLRKHIFGYILYVMFSIYFYTNAIFIQIAIIYSNEYVTSYIP